MYSYLDTPLDPYGDYGEQEKELERQRQLAIALYKNVISGANKNAEANGPYNGIAAFLGQALGGLGMQKTESDLYAKQQEISANRNKALKDYVSKWPMDTPGSQQYDIPSAAVGLPDFIGGPTQPEQQAPHKVSRQENLAYALKGIGLGKFGEHIAEDAITKSLAGKEQKYEIKEIAGHSVLWDPITSSVIRDFGVPDTPEERKIQELMRTEGMSRAEARSRVMGDVGFLPGVQGVITPFNRNDVYGAKKDQLLPKPLDPTAAPITPPAAATFRDPASALFQKAPPVPGGIDTDITGKIPAEKIQDAIVKYEEMKIKHGIPQVELALQAVEDMVNKYKDKDGKPTNIPGIGYLSNTPAWGAISALMGDSEPQLNQNLGQGLQNISVRSFAGQQQTKTELENALKDLGKSVYQGEEAFRQGIVRARNALEVMKREVDATVPQEILDIVSGRKNRNTRPSLDSILFGQ